MSTTFGLISNNVINTLRDPRGQARWMFGLDIPRTELWLALLLTVILNVVLVHVSLLMSGSGEVTDGGQISPVFAQFLLMQNAILERPVIHVILQMSLATVTVFMIYFVSRVFGGRGGFGGGIILLAWIQFISAILSLAQLIAYVVIPPLGGLIGVASLIIFPWLMANFIVELHGFKSLGRVFTMMVVTFMGFVFGLTFILTLIGLTLPGAF